MISTVMYRTSENNAWTKGHYCGCISIYVILLYFLFVTQFSKVLSQSATKSMTSSSETTPTQNLSTNSSSSICPSPCFCNSLSRIVYCSRRGLMQIPLGIAGDSLQLNLNSNPFSNTHISRSNFSRLTNLEHLYLSECSIRSIGVHTFMDLTRLKWLDLSNNAISSIEPLTFSGSSLQHLFLNANRHLRLNAQSFLGLQTTGLYLHDCAISTLPPDVILHLNSTLRYLWLNGNKLTTLDRSLFSLLVSLSHLRLANNPWHCSCSFSWMKEFYDSSDEIFKEAAAPSCFTPQPLRGKFFGDIRPGEFLCQAPMFTNIDTDFGRDSVRLKCEASGDPIPDIQWILPSGKIIRFPPSSAQTSTSERRKSEDFLSTPVASAQTDLPPTFLKTKLAEESAQSMTSSSTSSSTSSISNSSHTSEHAPFTNSALLELVRSDLVDNGKTHAVEKPQNDLSIKNLRHRVSPHLRTAQSGQLTRKESRKKVQTTNLNEDRHEGVQNQILISGNGQKIDAGSFELMGTYLCVATNRLANSTLTVNVTWSTLAKQQLSQISSINQRKDTQLTDQSLNEWMNINYDEYEYANSVTLSPPPSSSLPWRPDDRSQRRTGSRSMIATSGINSNNYSVISPAEGPDHVHDVGVEPLTPARRFSASEMACAVVGSHVCTLLLCLLTIPFYCRNRRRQRKREQLRRSFQRQHTAAAAAAMAATEQLKVKNIQRSSTRSSTLQRPCGEIPPYINDSLGLTAAQFYLSDYLIAPHQTHPMNR